MLIIKPGCTALTSIVAEMLCIEAGAVIVTPDLKSLQLPHAAYPTIKINPITKLGKEIVIHYRPTVGMIYYTESDNFCVQEFVQTISLQLTKFSHLMQYRSGSSASTLRQDFNPTNDINLITKYGTSNPDKNLYARSLQWIDASNIFNLNLIRPYNKFAAFTWIFMPIRLNLHNLSHFDSLNKINCIISSVFYDVGQCCIIPGDSQVYKLDETDFIPEYV